MNTFFKVITAGIVVGLILNRKKVVEAGKELVEYGLSLEQEAFIKGLNKVAQPVYAAWISDITKSGWRVIVISGFRPGITSEYEFGSFHNYGMALDINAQKGTTYLNSKSSKTDWLNSGIPDLAKKHNLRWGGNFVTTYYDPNHTDMGNLFTTSQLYALATKQGVTDEGNKVVV